jgi:hypothetical protein
MVRIFAPPFLYVYVKFIANGDYVLFNGVVLAY